MIITFHPHIFVVPYVCGVVANVQRTNMIDDRIQWVSTIAANSIVVALRHKRRHIQFGRKRYECRDFLIHRTGMFETFQMETNHHRQCAHRQLFRWLLIRFARRTLDFGTRAQVFGARKTFKAIDQRFWWSTALLRFAQVQRNVPKWIDRRGDTLTRLANNITLQSTGEYLIDDAIAFGRIRIEDDIFLVFVLVGGRLGILAMMVQNVECGNEEFVRVLLLVAGQMPCMIPNEMQQSMQRYWSFGTRIEFLEQTRYLAHQTFCRQFRRALVSLGNEIAMQQRGVNEGLEYAIHKARRAQVQQPT